ncbi:MAG TPA: DUF547 domain-containing protein [Candidatus Omnitrophota bacterium]|nr:DUF547 domain-containing protein [Candidatus Omnitrophota bacterium]
MFFKRAAAPFLFLVFFTPLLFAQGFDHSDLDSFLKRHVDDQGRLDYAAVSKDRADLDRYLDSLSQVDIKAISSGPESENLAFWVNVYHAGLVAAVLENYPILSTQDVPSFWDRQFLVVGAQPGGFEARHSLSQIRSQQLSGLEEEKIHLVLATASVSGPLFPKEAFTGLRAAGQLFKRVRSEVQRPEMVKVDVAAKRVVLSQLFQWYAPDFVEKYNRPERRAKLSRPDTAVVNFLINYSKNIEQIRFLKSGQFKVEYFPYDWSLNDRLSS